MANREWGKSGLSVDALTGDSLGSVLADLARLRIEVFRAFPYLYDGDLAYERDYLEKFASARGAIIVVVRDGDKIVGASTGAPLSEVEEEWRAPFEAAGRDPSQIFYCGESVLLPEYRGRGIGHAFFDGREAQARELKCQHSTFCGVIRTKGHPAEPNSYEPLDNFWQKRGYQKLDGIVARFGWKDIGAEVETKKSLQFWGRDL